MKNRGNNIPGRTCISILIFNCLFFLLPISSPAQFYFLNSYVSPDDSVSDFMQIHTMMVNLEEKEIVNSIVLADSGTLLEKNPIKISNNQNAFLISFWATGMMAKNSGFGGGVSNLHFSIIHYQNDNLNILRENTIPAATIELLDQTPNSPSFRLSVVSDTGNTNIMQPGIYKLDSRNRIIFERSVSIHEIAGSIGNLNGFALLRKVWGADQHHLYHSFHKSQYWLVKLNEENAFVIDSLQLRENGGQATIYAYHPDREKFYCFHVNYEMHGQYTHKSRQDYYANPEVLIYDPANLELLAQYPIADYPEGAYPGKENGLGDVVGDYIVYYFFEDDWMGKYAPAMLFIFDTRTNEASWLRVGWR